MTEHLHDTDADVRPHPGPGGSAAASPTLRWSLAALLVLVSVVAAVVVTLEISSLRPRSQEQASQDKDRSAAVAAAERFTVQYNTYDPASLSGYAKRVETMLSPKSATDFSKTIDDVRQAITTGKVDSKGQVLASAVASIDPDSAQVLVVADADVSTVYDKSLARHFRWQVSMVKINGRWLVDKYEPVS